MEHSHDLRGGPRDEHEFFPKPRPRRGRPKTVVVTGASAGVGRATARAFAARGDNVVLVARGRDGLEGAARDVEELGGTPLISPGDVADPETSFRALEAAERAFGGIDVWVNNAMTAVFSKVWDTEPEEFRRVTEVTYLGFVYGTLAALRHMRQVNAGIIIQVGSALAYRGIPLQASYCGAKHAIQGFCDSLWTELINEGSRVRMTMIQLPGMNTPQFSWVKSRLPNRSQPVPPIYQPEIAADAIVWASERNRREVWVGEPTVYTILGNNVAPWFADQYLAKNGISGQQMDEPDFHDRPFNLWEPLPGDHGAHGEFDARAYSFSPQFFLNKHRGKIAAGLGIAAGALALAAMKGRNGRSEERARLGTGRAEEWRDCPPVSVPVVGTVKADAEEW